MVKGGPSKSSSAERQDGRPSRTSLGSADGLGVQPPPGVPQTFLEPVDDPLGDVVGRYARTHGPFTSKDASTSLNLPLGVVETALANLERLGRVAEGAFRPGGEGREWVDNSVLRRLKRRSLAVLRNEIEPVEPSALARFGVAWQGVTPSPPRGKNALSDPHSQTHRGRRPCLSPRTRCAGIESRRGRQ